MMEKIVFLTNGHAHTKKNKSGHGPYTHYKNELQTGHRSKCKMKNY